MDLRPISLNREKVTWGELSCPKKVGVCQFGGEVVRAKNIQMIVAGRALHGGCVPSPAGPPEFMLGHRVAQ